VIRHCAALLAVGSLYLLGTGAAATQQTPRSTAPVSPLGSVGHAGEAGLAQPTRLTIPVIDVDVPVERIGLTVAGAVDVPRSPTSAGWYGLGSAPGQPGDAIIVGHLDTAEGAAVFSDLHRLRPGDTISVTLADGRAVHFRVEHLTYYPYTAPPAEMYATSGPPELSLVTCSGRWDAGLHTYLERLVVTALRTGG